MMTITRLRALAKLMKFSDYSRPARFVGAPAVDFRGFVENQLSATSSASNGSGKYSIIGMTVSASAKWMCGRVGSR